MKLKNILGLVVSALVLNGCVINPKDADEAKVTAAFESEKPFEELYYQLTNPATNEPICDDIFRSAVYPERGEFRVYYGIVNNLMYAPPLVHSAVYGYRTERGTRIEIRNTIEPKFGKQRSATLVNFIKTGRCE